MRGDFMPIRLLDAAVADKIAAGEVVERPASIVKELVENSIDAGSTSVTVDIINGGISSIRITDNGCGIPADEVATAFLRHATSKIFTEDDLYNIVTLGFRGEALASIAAVAKVQMLTRTAGSDYGTEVLINGGELERVNAAGCPEGTNIIVRDLFYNTPARRKFLKKSTQEAGYIGDMVSRLILAYPTISFKYITDGKTQLHSPGDGSMLSAIHAVYGKQIAENCISVDFTQDEIRIIGYLGNRELQKNNRSYQTLFVNDRYIKNTVIGAAVASAYEGRLNIGKFPFFVLRMELPPVFVDVNVHPNKLEVRFADGLPIYNIVHLAVKSTLRQHQEIPVLYPEEEETPEPLPVISTEEKPEQTYSQDKPIDIPAMPLLYTNEAGKIRDSGDGTNIIQPAANMQTEPTQQPVQASMADVDLKDSYHVLGQMFMTYIIIEGKTDAYIIDQHAAHERLLYERLYAQWNKGEVASQSLLLPQVLSLNHTEYRLVEGLLPFLQELGYDIAPIGGLSLGIKAIPLLLGQTDTAAMITSLLDENNSMRSYKTADLKREKLMQIACKSAVKAGDSLTQAEVSQLMRLIKDEHVPLSCPHGRPILIKLTQRELELRFKRIQS